MLMMVPEIQRKEFESLYCVVGAQGRGKAPWAQRERGMKLEIRSKAPGYQLPAWSKGEVWSRMDREWEGSWSEEDMEWEGPWSEESL